MTKYWFKAKNYGWGWYPATKEGWAVLVTYLVAIFASAFLITEISTSEEEFTILYITTTLVLTVVMLFITYKTGEKPNWRWGNKSK